MIPRLPLNTDPTFELPRSSALGASDTSVFKVRRKSFLPFPLLQVTSDDKMSVGTRSRNDISLIFLTGSQYVCSMCTSGAMVNFQSDL